ncbi:EamA family transporter [Tessaracoccus aquimaris]|uniref:EamA family transporter n=1 Tax=Tessaracoccus aquimaris TaxID=1332264 RepID=A0A1Q2CJH2_9ACTN|nr:EamA family transporter [Tessaracoccus aquimaris]AQP46261.1 EamA family transporter [Tessaracoccus aquimaris]
MESKLRWMLIAAIPPVLWGSTYFVNSHFMPADSPLWGAALRAAPAGLLLLLFVRRLPSGSWWWRSALLGLLNIGGFFLLIFLAAQLLPSAVASSVMALAPIALTLSAWGLLGQRPTAVLLAGAALGALGVPLLVGVGSGNFQPWGLAASLGAMAMNSVGSILARRWQGDIPILHTTCWQLLWGGGALVVAALLLEGTPPHLGLPQIGAVAYLSILATAVAYLCWFGALAHLDAGVVGVVGLLNPVAGVTVGLLVGHEHLGATQWLGLAIVLGSMVAVQAHAARRRPANTHPAPAPLAPRHTGRG